MDAVVFAEFGEAAVRNVPRPEPAPGEVLVAVDRVQLSVTECQLYRGERVTGHEAVTRRIENGNGRVFGHEFCGTTVETGAAVDSIDPGDRVYAPGPVPCGNCAYCRSDNRALCDDRNIIGMDRPGALAEYLTLPADALRVLPDGVSDAAGAALQPLASAVIDVYDADVTVGDVVAVVGAGVMGNHCGQVALTTGASQVFAVDLRADMVALADEHGLVGLDARTDPVEERVLDATDGMGADVVFEAAGGHQESATAGDGPLARAFDLVRNGGTVSQVGIIPGQLSVEPMLLQHSCVSWVNGRDLAGSVETGPSSDSARTAIDLVTSGRVSVEGFVTHELAGLDAVDEAVEITTNKGEHGAYGPAQIALEH